MGRRKGLRRIERDGSQLVHITMAVNDPDNLNEIDWANIRVGVRLVEDTVRSLDEHSCLRSNLRTENS
jgi:hypothetical protein